MSREMLVFLLSMCPVIELRGGMLAAALLKLPVWKGVVLSLVGNMIPIPIFLFIVKKIMQAIRKRKKKEGRFTAYFRRLGEKNNIQKTQFWGLLTFVAIPLPGTGAWSGGIIAGILNLSYRKSLMAIYGGMCIALSIMYLVSYVIVGNLVH